jgi:aspartyl-tRNA(Asn)/glutamyl-tRNA(Gln) amidotransferase subunit A
VSAGGNVIADRLRANLRAADIPASDADVERLLADGSLSRMEEYVRALRGVGDDLEPDYSARSSLARGAGPTHGAAPADRAAPSAGRAAVAAQPATPRRESGSGGEIPDTIAGVAPLLREGVVSPVELVERALARIAERDGELNAFQLVLDERARAAASEAEAEIGRGGWRGPLHGVPVAVKDLFDVAGTITTAGGKRAAWTASTADAAAVDRLSWAGAIVVGKTRLPEYAFWPGSTNPHYGPTANPHDTSRDAGGSSSGSAAAVADGIVYAALGSDTGGSIRIPAALCGVVGLKPTYGRVSLEGCVPLAWSLDHAGPLTRSIEDAALVLDALAGGGAPPSSAGLAGKGGGRAAVADAQEVAKGLRVGVLGDDGRRRALATDDALEQWRASLRALEAAGATLVDVDLPEMPTLRAVNFLVLSVEAATYHAPALRTRYGDYGEPCRSRLLAGFAYDATDFVQAHRFRSAARRQWSTVFDRVDVLSTPSQPDVAPPLGEMASVKFTSPFNALGWPAVSVPFGEGAGGLPLATQLVGAPWREDIVLGAARALEKVR